MPHPAPAETSQRPSDLPLEAPEENESTNEALNILSEEMTDASDLL